jgi:hypothetical protein
MMQIERDGIDKTKNELKLLGTGRNGLGDKLIKHMIHLFTSERY